MLYVQHYTIDGCCAGWGRSDDHFDDGELEHVEYTASDVS